MKDRRITRTAKIALIVMNVGLFAFVWANFYNHLAFRSHREYGMVGSIFAFFVIYMWLSKLYRAYAIASSTLEETVLSQLISFGIADLALYIASVLLHRSYVNIIPGAIFVVLQLLSSTVIIWLTKRYMLKHVTPSPTVLVYGRGVDKERAEHFGSEIGMKYGHLFAVTPLPDDDEGAVLSGVDAYETVIFMGVDMARRERYIERCLSTRKVFYLVPEFEDIIIRGCSVKNYLDTPMLRYDYNYDRQRSATVKRACDIFFSLFFLVLLSPLLLVTAVAIKLDDHGPIFYRQERVTRNGKKFNILKFRSMVVDAERYGAIPATENDPRITKVGAVIRKYRIDEMPQLINILRGHMSFVGPRPERVLHETLYEQQLPEFKYRLRVKGGLTGYAQVYGKYNTPPEDKIKLDMLYIEHQSLILDLKLVLLTIKILFRPESTEGFDHSRSQTINQKDREHNPSSGD